VDGGGRNSVELENRRGRKVTVGSNPTPSATESPISVSLPLNSRNRRVHGVSCDRSSPEKVESLKLCRRLGSVSLIAIQAVTFATISLCRIFRSGAKERGIPRNRVRDHVTEEKVSCPGQMRRLSQGSSRKAIGGSGALRIRAPSSAPAIPEADQSGGLLGSAR
jgi:hypothetical protein